MRSVYLAFVGFVALQRLSELLISRSNRRKLASQGYVQVEDRLSWIAMLSVHVGWIVCMAVEPFVSGLTPSSPAVFVLGAAVFVLAQAGRVWVISSLGTHWNVSVMSPGGQEERQSFVSEGPYRFVRHPNYLVVILEVASLPIMGGAYLTAVIFSVLNYLVLERRISLEEEALFRRPGYRETMGGRGRILPRFAS